MSNDFLDNFLTLRNIATEVGINTNGMKPAPRFGPAAATTAVPDDRQLCASAPACLPACLPAGNVEECQWRPLKQKHVYTFAEVSCGNSNN